MTTKNEKAVSAEDFDHPKFRAMQGMMLADICCVSVDEQRVKDVIAEIQNDATGEILEAFMLRLLGYVYHHRIQLSKHGEALVPKDLLETKQ